PDGCRAGESRKKSQADERLAENMASNPGEETDQRRLIDVTSTQMFGTRQIIKFVTKDTVAIRDEKMEDEVRGRDRKHDRGSALVLTTASVFGVDHKQSCSDA